MSNGLSDKNKPAPKAIATVRKSNAGPYLDIDGEQVLSWLGTVHNEFADELAQKINAAAARSCAPSATPTNYSDDAIRALLGVLHLNCITESGGIDYEQAVPMVREWLRVSSAPPAIEPSESSSPAFHAALSKLKQALGGNADFDATLAMLNAATRINRLQDTLDGKYLPSSIAPREPTAAMLAAAQDATTQGHPETGSQSYTAIWCAMYDAAVSARQESK